MNTERPDNDDTSGTSGDVRGVGDAAKGSAKGPQVDGSGAGGEVTGGETGRMEKPGSTAPGAEAGRSEPDETGSTASGVEAAPSEAAEEVEPTRSDTEAERPEDAELAASEAEADRPEGARLAASKAAADDRPEGADPTPPEPAHPEQPVSTTDTATELSLHDHSPETDDDRRPARSRSPLVIASVAAAVLLVGGGGAYLASSSSTSGGSGEGTGSAASGADGTPPPLALDGYSSGGTSGIASGEPNPYGETYRAVGSLPGGPDSAAVYAPEGEVSKDAVSRLAKALGVVGTPVAEGQVWKVGGQDGTGPSLQVNKAAPGMWTFSRYAPGTDDCTGGTLKCTHDPGTSATEPVSAAVAEKAAAPILKAVGQDDAKVDASQLMGAQRVVNAQPVIGGLPTYGWTTGLTVSAQGEVVGGSGDLAAPMKGDVYPVLSARKTLDLMNAAPKTDHRMGIGGCASPVPLKDRLEAPCGQATDAASASATPTQAPTTVQHAVFGLAVHSVDGRQTLVPSWLFEARQPGGQDSFTLTYPAIDPKYLASANTPTPTASSTSTAKPHDVKADGYTADGKSLTVAFTGGVCADYKVSAVESSDKVTVTVTDTPWPNKICVMIAKIYHQTVQLKAPLGDRAVVGTDGTKIPVEKRVEVGAGPSLAR
ncbi:hypothetical protein [Streptomyces sp. NRRL F-525]|uniref:hypothetical protein n=1 Tax=Streptomyces sp. NRRL F-525 TaxID=1463861 RepID=UPI0005267BAB|nr:hypothetical protein [Streptomyces sp. NRRL F-525]